MGIGPARADSFSLEYVDRAARLFKTVLDGGIDFLDSVARSGVARELTGKTVNHRRDEFVLASKFAPP